MKVTVEQTSNLERRLKITVPAEVVSKEVEKRLQKAAQTVRLDGFRPGKVPANMIKNRFGAAIHQEAVGEILQQNFYQAIVQEKLNPVGLPKIELNQAQEGKDLEFTAIVEVMPELAEIKGLDQIKIEKPVAEVTEADVDQMFDTLRKQQAQFKAVKRKAKNEDRLMIDFEGFMDGKQFEGGSAKNVPLVLGSKRMIEGFEDGLIGVKADETRELNLSFPENYHVKELAGKAVTFNVTVNEVAESELAEVNEEFAKKFGVDSVETLRKEVRSNMERELEFNLKNRVKNQVMEGLLANNTVEVPQALIADEIVRLKEQAMSQFGIRQGKSKLPELPDELFTEQARRRVALGLLLNKLVSSHDIKPEANRIKAMIEKMASIYQDADEVVKHYTNDKKQYAEIEQLVLEEQLVEKVLEAAQVTEKKLAFSEVIQGNQAAQ